MKRKGIIIGLLLIIIVSSLFIHSGMKKRGREGVLKILSDKADLYIRDFHYTEVGDPESTWEIDADSAKYEKKKNLALLENVRVRLVTSDGRTFLMTGTEGRFHTDSKNIDVYGNVEIISDNGDRFTTDYINYSYSEKRVYTESSVTMENPRIRITGVGLSLVLKTKRLTLLSNVRALINDFNINP